MQSEQKISATEGGFGGLLDPDDLLAWSVASLGDRNGDGTCDVAVGVRADDDGGPDQGAVWILFLDADGTVLSEQKISETQGGFGGVLDAGDFFGSSAASLSDLDGDGIDDLAVGATADDDGGNSRGAVWILFLDNDGTVRSHQKISDTAGGFGGTLDNDDRFGWSVAALGDLDGNGFGDLAVGAPTDDDGGSNQGAVWTLFLGDSDTTPPAISCPSAVTARAPKSAPHGAFVSFTVSATDEFDPSPTLICAPPSGSFFPWGTTIVTCTATDQLGNQSTCMFPVTVWPNVRRR